MRYDTLDHVIEATIIVITNYLLPIFCNINFVQMYSDCYTITCAVFHSNYRNTMFIYSLYILKFNIINYLMIINKICCIHKPWYIITNS